MIEPNWIRADDLGVTFANHQRALSQVNFKCARGSFTAIVGPSGCGKSTLLRAVAGLQPVSVGRLHRGWQSAIGTPSASTDESVSGHGGGVRVSTTQSAPLRSAIDNIALPLELRRVARSTRIEAAQCARALVGLDPSDEPKLPRMLSGGMKMRVSLARALITHPDVMLLDEPFAAVDDLLRNRLNEEVSQLWYQNRWTTILVTHHVPEAVFLSQRVFVMTAAPGTIAAEIEVPFPFPRTPALRGSLEFANLTYRVTTALGASTP